MPRKRKECVAVFFLIDLICLLCGTGYGGKMRNIVEESVFL
jgi:hypothetical protein